MEVIFIYMMLLKSLFIGSGLGFSVSLIVVVFYGFNEYFGCLFDKIILLIMMGELEG